MVIALITGGEGWHNNHHYLPASARQGFTWWEFDPTWYALKGLAALHVVRDLKDPPARLLDQARVRDGAFDIGMFRSYWERAAKVTGERIADLSARPLAPSAESLDQESDGDVAGTERRRALRNLPANHAEPLSHLAGLISRALESADQLADSTRRTRGPTGPATRHGPRHRGRARGRRPPPRMTDGASPPPTTFASATLWIVDLDGVVWLTGEPIGPVDRAVADLRDHGIRVVFATNNSAPTTVELLGRLDRIGIDAPADDLATSAAAVASLLAARTAGPSAGRRRGPREPGATAGWRR